MKHIFIIEICIIIIVGINGASFKQSTSIDNDAKELTKLLENIWSLKPSITKRVDPILSCELTDKCCKGKNRMKATSLMIEETPYFNEPMFDKIIKICVNSSTSSEIDETCSTVIKSRLLDDQVSNEPAINEYLTIIGEHLLDMEMFPRWIFRNCNKEHLHALICLSNTKLVEACITDVLQMASDNDYIDYEMLVMNVKRASMKIITKLSKRVQENIEKE